MLDLAGEGIPLPHGAANLTELAFVTGDGDNVTEKPEHVVMQAAERVGDPPHHVGTDAHGRCLRIEMSCSSAVVEENHRDDTNHAHVPSPLGHITGFTPTRAVQETRS